MNLKKWKLISPIIIFIIASLSHFVYTIFPSIITSLIFPVNESIAEHMKLIYTSILLFSLIEYFVFKKLNIIVNNKGINPFISGISNIIVFLVMYLPLRLILNENMIITLITLFISEIITSFISYKLFNYRQIINDKLGIIISLIPYIFFIYFTYNPPHTSFFYDTDKEFYGIPKNTVK